MCKSAGAISVSDPSWSDPDAESSPVSEPAVNASEITAFSVEPYVAGDVDSQQLTSSTSISPVASRASRAS